MNKLMMTVAATMAFAAFAQEPAVPASDAAGAAPVAKAMRPHRPQMMGGAMDPLVRAVMNPKFASKIGLTDEQKAKLADLRGEKSKNRELQAKVRAGMEKQVELLKAEKIDEAAVMKAIDEVFEARKEMAKAQTRRTIAVRTILTPEQVAKALESMKELRGPRPARNMPSASAPKCEGAACEPSAEK